MTEAQNLLGLETQRKRDVWACIYVEGANIYVVFVGIYIYMGYTYVYIHVYVVYVEWENIYVVCVWVGIYVEGDWYICGGG